MDYIFTKDLTTIEKYSRKYRKMNFKKYGFKRNDHSYILVITRFPGISQDKIAQNLALDKGNVARQLTHLEEIGYIYRKISDTDKRVTEVYPTDKGIEIGKEIRITLNKWNLFLSSALSSEEEKAFKNTLQKLIAKAKEFDFEGCD